MTIIKNTGKYFFEDTIKVEVIDDCEFLQIRQKA
jgi:uncharacterized protein YqkB